MFDTHAPQQNVPSEEAALLREDLTRLLDLGALLRDSLADDVLASLKKSHRQHPYHSHGTYSSEED